LDMLRGMKMDVEKKRFQTLDELLDYCYCVAGTVGLMMCHIMGVNDAKALKNAVDLGNAMQLTNITRDVLDDWNLGRIYFPLQWVRDSGIDHSLFGDPIYRQRWNKLSERLLREADQLYQSGWRGITHLPFRAAFAVAVAANVYKHIGKKVLSAGPQAWDQRRYVSLPKKIFIALKTIFKVSFHLKSRSVRPWRKTKTELKWSHS
jgi:15-cis-phytoene synthase